VIPLSVDINGLWNDLPPGIHDATLDEIEQRFATNPKRKKLFEGLKAGILALRAAGCREVFLDGSFISEKPEPGDFDACWDPTGVDASKLDPVLLDFKDGRRNQKKKYYGEFFVSSASADRTRTFVKFFQIEKHTGKAKGIVRIHLKVSGAPRP
jgi:hypothetical protein